LFGSETTMPHLRLMDVNQEWHLLFCHSFLPLARNWCLVLVGTPEALFLYQRHLFVHLVHQKRVSCTNGIFLSIWYTRSAFPVPTHLLFHLVHQKRVSCTNTSLISFGTPEARLLYQWCAPVYSVHTKASSRTFSVLWNNRRPVLPGMKSYAHLKQHSLDN